MEHIHKTVAKYITIVGNAVELAGIMPEINKLNITIERRIVISRKKNVYRYSKRYYLLQRSSSYVMLIFHHNPVEEESQAPS